MTLSVQRLVKKYGHELNVVAWDSVLDISEALQKQIEVRKTHENTVTKPWKDCDAYMKYGNFSFTERRCGLMCSLHKSLQQMLLKKEKNSVRKTQLVWRLCLLF